MDLDALLEDLCSMEKDIMSSANDSGVFSNSSSTLGTSSANISDAASFQGNSRALSPKSPKSPVPANVSMNFSVYRISPPISPHPPQMGPRVSGVEVNR